jgi:hypothetical protein
MKKIASPNELHTELRALVARSTDGSSRQALAADLRTLATRVAGETVTLTFLTKGDADFDTRLVRPLKAIVNLQRTAQ